MINRKRTIRILGLILFSLAMSWLIDFLEPHKSIPKVLAPRPDHDFSIRKLDTRKFGQDGKLKYRLMANSLIHFPGKKSSELKQPTLIQYSADGAITRTTADKGSLADDNKIIEMRDNVISIQKNQAGALIARVNTNRLTLELK